MANYVGVRMNKDEILYVMDGESVLECVRNAPVGIATSINVTREPVLDGCTIRITVANGKICEYAIWYEGSTTYEDRPDYKKWEADIQEERSHKKLNTKYKEPAEKIYSYRTMVEAIKAMKEFA